MNKITLFFFVSTLFISCSQPEKELPKSNEIMLIDGWARPGKAGMMSAAYFKLKNNTGSPDTVLNILSDASKNTQMHLSFKTDDGLMSMKQQQFVAIPSKSEIEFKQGGLHVMIIQPDRDLVEGDSISLRLFLSSSKELVAKVPVKSVN
tara:strand:+ start:21626 stop:22072 length:447 start_codon:yes stop_codon:yes gene_type:complete